MKTNKKYKVIEQSRFLSDNELVNLKGGSSTELCSATNYFSCIEKYIISCVMDYAACTPYEIYLCAVQQVSCGWYGTYTCTSLNGYLVCGDMGAYLSNCPTKTLF
ncbi:MAG: hypothetical protein R3Y59_07740 [bacterium]